MAHYIDSFPGREIILNGQKHLYFGGTSYLGLQTDIAFQDIYSDNIKKYGTNYGASRNSNVRFTIFDKGEEYLANLVGSESCITMSSGYLAAQLLVQNFSSKNYQLFYAPNTHSALYSSKSKPYTTYTALNIALWEHLNSKKKITPVVLLDTIDFSGCNFPDFEGLMSLPLDRIILIADDSHGIGVVGSNGEGGYKKLKLLRSKELIVCCSLGKGFGIQAGAIFGTKERINQLRLTDFFGGASPAAPSGIASLLDAQVIILEKRKKLERNIALFLDHLNKDHIQHFMFMIGHPAFTFSNKKFITYLEHHHIIVTDFNYPSDTDDTMNRIILSAQHKNEDILKLSTLIRAYYF